MFIIRFFKYSFDIKNMIPHASQKLWKAIIYFFIISFITLFPLNFLIVQENGWNLDFIEANLSEQTPHWVLPEDMKIHAYRLDTTSDETYTFTNDDITYIFNAKGDENNEGKTVSFYEDKIIYADGKGHQMIAYGYKGFSDDVNFRALNLATGTDKSDMYNDFATMIEDSFGSYVVLYSLLMNSIVNISISIVFILLLSFVMQLFRFGYTSFFSYKESLIFIILAMGIPSVISFIVGFVAPSIAPVIYQFGVGIVVMGVMLKYGKQNFA